VIGDLATGIILINTSLPALHRTSSARRARSVLATLVVNVEVSLPQIAPRKIERVSQPFEPGAGNRDFVRVFSYFAIVRQIGD
jgi:hypothetical protein